MAVWRRPVGRPSPTPPGIEIVGAIDAHPSKAGLDLGEAAGVGRTLGITVAYEAEPVLKDVYADVVIHSTGSSLTTVYPQLMSIISSEKSVISSCEELSFPWLRPPDISRKLDRRARETGVRLLGTGVNPGVIMDFLPLVLATACQQVRSLPVGRGGGKGAAGRNHDRGQAAGGGTRPRWAPGRPGDGGDHGELYPRHCAQPRRRPALHARYAPPPLPAAPPPAPARRGGRVTIQETSRRLHPRSAELHEQAVRTFPSGVTHDIRHLEPFPLYVDHASGSRKWDVDGNEIIDYVMGHGAVLLGPAYPDITRAVQEQVAGGTHYGAGHELELKWGAAVRRLVPSAEMVRFTSSGTEATLMAVRPARASTGRGQLLQFDYHFHGWHDSVVGARYGESDVPRSAGVPEATLSNTISIPQHHT